MKHKSEKALRVVVRSRCWEFPQNGLSYLVTTFVLMEYIMSTLMSESVLHDEEVQNPKRVRLEADTAPLEPGSRLGQRIA